ncbi:hypothetical protein ACNONS_03775 [Bacteroides xylanisolvens]|jgi:hypothetical protein|uniref:hypothetical protein n=1 Tax=Bacteroides TaxID=816 RepID=UPI000EFE59FC|nr:hypothetical protein DWZ35_03040 [Bacteroides caccae]
MRKIIHPIPYACLHLVGTVSLAGMLYFAFGAIVTAIYAIFSITTLAYILYELHRAPLMEDEDDSSTDNQ